MPAKKKTAANGGAVRFTHPDRVYWPDLGVTKQDLADYYREIWPWMAPHVVGRPISLVRCPDGIKGECFVQKHARDTFPGGHVARSGRGKAEMLSIAGLRGALELVQAGALEIHVWGTKLGDVAHCDRMVLDLDPGAGVSWAAVATAAREARDRLDRVGLRAFVKTSGGRGAHIIVPLRPTEWEETRAFARALAAAMAADAPKLYTAKMGEGARHGRVFIDYLRNSRGATSVAPYSPRARAGAPVSTPVAWSELGGLKSSARFTLANLGRRLSGLAEDPWHDMTRMRQALPDVDALRPN